MTDSRKELIEKIRLGEDRTLELKTVQFSGSRVTGPRRDALADELAAFANATGGVCILGVDDGTREITGIPLEHLDAAEAFVREIAQDSIDPPLLPEIDRVMLPNASGSERPVLLVGIKRSLFVHRSPGGFFHRVGSSKRQMSTQYLATLFQQRSQSRIIRFDEEVVATSTLDDLAPKLVDRFRTERSPASTEEMLQKLGMAGRVEGEIRPTVAGVLLASLDPTTWVRSAFIQAVAYQGNDIVTGEDRIYQLDAFDCVGPLDEQIVSACRFVFRNMKTRAVKNMGRRDLPQYDMEAVFEAVVNAVAHRDYSIYGSKTRLRMFSDRLELYSPGALPNTMEVGDLAFRQAARNETIVSLLAKCRIPDHDWLKTSRKTFTDRRGEGVPLILSRSETISGRTPVYEMFGDELRLTIYAAYPDETIHPRDMEDAE